MVGSKEISKSEEKRLSSLRQRKLAFKEKEQQIRNALNNLDDTADTSRNNKIIFDDSINVTFNKTTKISKKKILLPLFDIDSDDEKTNNIDNQFLETKNVAPMLGNDKRFTLDSRFQEKNKDGKENVLCESEELVDLKQEKDWQLNILENVLDAPIPIKNNIKSKTISHGKVIRYDPVENHHLQFEITQETNTNLKDKKKRKKNDDIPLNTADNEVHTSKEIFYSVSSTLKDNLNERGSFNLLKSHLNEAKIDDYKETEDVNEKTRKFSFNFNSKNPFKYDSSDDENDVEFDESKEGNLIDQHNQEITNEFKTNNNFFFDVNDSRFSEAKKFFAKPILNERFQDLRQELRRIVKTKIRNNEKRRSYMGKKRSINSIKKVKK
ncbi:probable RNA-binding protein CG14230 [Prorops nasuta]|uniref:probable RNA-binding protein CG14230 n=1 Tax=Prorops nasuta TaxID=863751 RepID=UPI0034CE3943